MWHFLFFKEERAMENQMYEQSERRDYWLGHIRGWSESGLSQTKYCETKDISYHSFQYWRKRLSRDKEQAAGSLVSVVDLGRMIELRDKMNMGHGPTPSGVTIHCGPFRVSLDEQFNVEVLCRALGALRMV